MTRIPPMVASGVWRVLPWVLGLLALFVVASVAIFLLRRHLRSREPSNEDAPLTLTQVREMRERGEIDEREFETLKRVVRSQLEQPSGRPTSSV